MEFEVKRILIRRKVKQMFKRNLKVIYFVAVLGYVVATATTDEDYCDPKICPPEAQPHVACDTELVCSPKYVIHKKKIKSKQNAIKI